jgi:hypothetical protein
MEMSMNDKAGRCGWVERGFEDEVAEASGLPASGTYETWGLIGWPIEPSSPEPDYGPLNETDLFEVEEDEEGMFILRLNARDGEDLLDVVDRIHNGYMLTCKRRRLTPRYYFFEGFDGRCVALGT